MTNLALNSYSQYMICFPELQVGVKVIIVISLGMVVMVIVSPFTWTLELFIITYVFFKKSSKVT